MFQEIDVPHHRNGRICIPSEAVRGEPRSRRQSRVPKTISLTFFKIEELELIVRRGYLTVSLSTPKTGKLLLRKPDGIRRWYQVVQVCLRGCHKMSKECESTDLFLRNVSPPVKKSRRPSEREIGFS